MGKSKFDIRLKKIQDFANRFDGRVVFKKLDYWDNCVVVELYKVDCYGNPVQFTFDDFFCTNGSYGCIRFNEVTSKRFNQILHENTQTAVLMKQGMSYENARSQVEYENNNK